MAVPEGPRPRPQQTSRAVARAAPGLLGGSRSGLSPTGRGPQGSVRRESGAGKDWLVEGVVEDIVPAKTDYPYFVWDATKTC